MSTNMSVSTSMQPSWLERIRMYLELIRFSHTVFALPFVVLASVWALLSPLGSVANTGWERSISLMVMRGLGVLLCMVTGRSFAMAFNRLVDARIDAQNPRTANRHLPAGLLRTSQVWLFTLGCAVLFVAACALFLPNRLPLILSVPVLLFLAGYSFAKRFTSNAHFWLGLALGIAPMCAWIALRGEVVQSNLSDLAPVSLLGLGVLLWVAGFDIIYACQDYDVDRRLGLYSIPARLGIGNALRLAALCHFAMIVVMVYVGWRFSQLNLGWIWQVALVAIGILLVIEHRLVSKDNLSKVNLAFFHLNAIIGVVLCVAGSVDAWL